MNSVTRFLLIILLVLGSGTAAAQGMRFEGLSAELVAALSRAQAETERRVATMKDAASRAEAWGELGMIYHAQHLPFAAEQAYGEGLAEAGDSRWYYLRAIARSERGELDLAIVDYRMVTELRPDYMAAWYRLGAGLLVQDDLVGAEEALDRARELAPDAAIVLAGLADVATAREDYPKALALLERARFLAPDAGQLAYKLAMVNRRIGDAAKAKGWLDERGDNNAVPVIDDPLLLEVASISNNARFFMKAGEWALERGDFGQAARAFESAASLAPSDPTMGVALAYALSMAGRDEQALQEVRRVLNVDTDAARAWYTLAWLLRASDSKVDQEEARAAARRSLELKEDEQTRTLAAALSMRAGQFERAAADFAQLVSLNPKQAYYHYWHGVALLGGGNCDAAKPLATAIVLRRSWGEAHLVLARAHAICGDSAAAQRRALALLKVRDDPDNRITMALVEFGLGRLDTARELAGAELPHPDAEALLEAMRAKRTPRVFSSTSSWWLPAELQ